MLGQSHRASFFAPARDKERQAINVGQRRYSLLRSFKDVYDVVGGKGAAGAPPSASEALRSSTKRWCAWAGSALVKPALPEMERLFAELPNFAEVLADIRKHLALCIPTQRLHRAAADAAARRAGHRQDHFARKVAELLGTGFGFVPMSSLTAGWVLSGASSQWKNAKPGKVFDTFVNGDYANPVIVVDELDKASGDGQYDPLGALYELLEVKTATRFVDEFAELPIDASGAVWLAPGERREPHPEPLLDRLTVYEIEAPDPAGSRAIAAAIYREIRNSHDWGRHFPEAPSGRPGQARLDAAARMRRALQGAFGSAKLAGRSELRPDDMQDPRAKKQRIGF